ncbi:MFS transporter [Parageobacillus thermoglucosidasius]|uniref:MFS transporter n=1 Tax=Parageobacillus thermoglucosidasius TaxID=1426 RepID=UPI000E12DAAD|nr:MFS transporter [Parageobacillus thermoglucosidasius]RDE27411.1 MFS transporter [Parageobacillus thermoglucosidasius]
MFQLAQEKKLSQQAVITLFNHSVYHFGNSLSTIFLNIYLWRLTNSLLINGLFNLIAIFSQALTTFSIGKVAKKKDRLTFYRIGIFLTAFFYLCIIVSQKHILNYFYFFALLRGISQALYWLGYFTLSYEVSSDQNRHRYLGWNQIVMNVTNLAGPAVASFIISLFVGLKGYTIVFSLAFLMFVIASGGSFKIKKQTRYRSYYMKYLPLIIKKEPDFKKTLIGWFIIGFPQGILSFVPSILLYTIFLNEQPVAYLNILFLSLSILSSYVISRFASIEATVQYLMISAIGFTISSLPLLFNVTIGSFVLFMSLNSIFKPLQSNSYEAHYYRWINILPLKEHFRIEAIVLRESLINIGRSLGVAVFLLFSKEMNSMAFPWIIFSMSIFQWLLPVMAKKRHQVVKRFQH